jgi:hypothetical protein
VIVIANQGVLESVEFAEGLRGYSMHLKEEAQVEKHDSIRFSFLSLKVFDVLLENVNYVEENILSPILFPKEFIKVKIAFILKKINIKLCN